MSHHRQPKPRVILDSLGKDYRPLAKAAVAAGWTISISRGGHPKLTSPSGQIVPLPSSSNGANLHKAIRAKLRKMGVEA